MFQRLRNLWPWKQVSGQDEEFEKACELLEDQNDQIAALNAAVVLLHRRNENNIRESTNVLAAVLATYNGRITIDGNIIDAVVNSTKKLEIKMSEPKPDGSRTLTLIEHDEEPSENKGEEPTDEQLDEIDMSRDIFIEDENYGDDDEDLAPV